MSVSGLVRFSVEGFHNWPEATGRRSYLADRHRHVFGVEVVIELRHNERDIEFHDFLDFCKTSFPSGELGGASCETLATDLAQKITAAYSGRAVKVTVLEDGENGSIYEFRAND